ncbi:MAG: cytochrome c biogenesis protein ResB, partial [Gammaproteobacteria bacterium]
SPGKPVVYLGCALLIIGIFLLFYLPQRRFWVIVKENKSGSDLLLAGMSNRNPREFDTFFKHISQTLRRVSGNSD